MAEWVEEPEDDRDHVEAAMRRYVRYLGMTTDEYLAHVRGPSVTPASTEGEGS